MSFLTRRRVLEYHQKRESLEGFKKGFIQPTPEFELMKYLMIYPMRFRDFYYLSISDYARYFLDALHDVAETKGWETVHKMALIARKAALIKDTPLIVAEYYPNKKMIMELLAEYPIPKITLYAEIARQRHIAVSWGRRKKSAIAKILNEKPVEWHEFQAIKYRRSFVDILRMVHPKPANTDIAAIWGWIVGKREAPTPRIEAYEKAMRSDPATATSIAIENDLPWEVIRSRIGGLEKIPSDLLYEAARKIMSHLDVLMQYRTLVEKVGENRALRLLKTRMPRIPMTHLSRFIVNAIKAGDKALLEAAGHVFGEVKRRGTEILNEISLFREKPGDVRVLIDVSGSMEDTAISRAAMIAIALSGVASEFRVFNDEYRVPREIELRDVGDVAHLIDMPRGGTPLLDAVKWMIDNSPRDTLIIVLTDEQENASVISTEEFNKELARRKASMLAVALGPYPTDFIAKKPLTNVVGVAGSDVQALAAAWRMLELVKKQSELLIPERLLEELETIYA